VHLEIRESAGELAVEIRDDGSGMIVDDTAIARSYGLAGMRHRIEGLGGRFALVSEPGRGTLIRIRIPRHEHLPSPVTPGDAEPR
jgi:signal transduction histidine kinase